MKWLALKFTTKTETIILRNPSNILKTQKASAMLK